MDSPRSNTWKTRLCMSSFIYMTISSSKLTGQTSGTLPVVRYISNYPLLLQTSELYKKIRSANLSGDCKWDRELFRRGVLGFTKHHQVRSGHSVKQQFHLCDVFQTCVRRRAVLSVSQHPNCSSTEDAERAVNEAWESCIGDTRPFDEVRRRSACR